MGGGREGGRGGVFAKETCLSHFPEGGGSKEPLWGPIPRALGWGLSVAPRPGSALTDPALHRPGQAPTSLLALPTLLQEQAAALVAGPSHLAAFQ